MTKVQSLLLKALLFLAGLGLIFGAFKICVADVEAMTNLDKYLWINIAVLYVIFFFPFFFSSVTLENVDRKVPSLVTSWISILLIEIVNIPIMICVFKEVTPYLTIKVSIIIESVMVFLAMIFTYFGAVGNSQIQKVAVQENQRISLIKEIRSMTDLLVLKAAGLPENCAPEKTRISKLQENMRYMAPAGVPGAAELEEKIQSEIRSIDNAIDEVIGGADPANLKTLLSSVEMHVSQRKLIRS